MNESPIPVRRRLLFLAATTGRRISNALGEDAEVDERIVAELLRRLVEDEPVEDGGR